MPMEMPGMKMEGMNAGSADVHALPNEVSFPYGFPTPGRYRLFVQMKHGDTVEVEISGIGVLRNPVVREVWKQ